MKTSTSKKTFTEEVKGTASEVISKIKELIKEGNTRRVMIQDKEGKILFQTQLTAGIAGSALLTAMAPIVSAISMFALFMNDVKIIVEKYPEGEGGADEYEVEAEVVVEVEDEEAEEEEPKKKSAAKGKTSKKEDEEEEEKTDKTVGKKKKDDK